MTDKDLSQLQLDILDLESKTWRLAGSKISAFRQLHPLVTETGYYLALLRMLDNQAAYEYDGQRYAPLLKRLSETHRAELAQRVGLRSATPQP